MAKKCKRKTPYFSSCSELIEFLYTCYDVLMRQTKIGVILACDS